MQSSDILSLFGGEDDLRVALCIARPKKDVWQENCTGRDSALKRIAIKVLQAGHCTRAGIGFVCRCRAAVLHAKLEHTEWQMDICGFHAALRYVDVDFTWFGEFAHVFVPF